MFLQTGYMRFDKRVINAWHEISKSFNVGTPPLFQFLAGEDILARGTPHIAIYNILQN